ncbi:MAG: hypothetical protein EKK53_18615 [Burkholderiales bacterium]|nr:MAG: hypothetical protein EKK53_18615 [Burkholderiales bacterium]
MNRPHRLMSLLLCAALASCTTMGNGRVRTLQSHEAAELLQPGRTTQAEARQRLGPGSVLRFQSGWLTEQYVYRDGLPRALDFVPVVGLVTAALPAAETELVLLYSPDGVLRKFKLRRTGTG